MTGAEVAAEYRQQMKLLASGIFRIVVMGEIKKGKSSFINALLGFRELVPTGTDITTSSIYKIRYGAEVAYRVFFTVDSGKPVLPIGRGDLAKFGTEDGNPGNREQVDFIEVSCPSPLLQSGVVIIDTPGLGGVITQHRKTTYRYVPKADAVFFVTDSVDAPIGKLETDCLGEVRDITKYVYFIQTKTASGGTEASLSRRDYNLGVLSSAMKVGRAGIPYFLVDSELRMAANEEDDRELLKASGFPGLLSFINQKLLPAQRRILAEKAVLRAAPVLQRVNEVLQEKERFLNADTAQMQQRATSELKDAMTKLQEWNSEGRRELVDDIRKGLKNIQFQAMERLSACRPGGCLQQELEDEYIYPAVDEESLKTGIEAIKVRLPQFVTRYMMTMSRDLQKETEKLLARHSVTSSGTTELPAVIHTSANADRLGQLIKRLMQGEQQGPSFRGCWFGMSVGVSVGTAIGSIVPGVGSAAGAVIGGFLGLIGGVVSSIRTADQTNARNLANAKQQACATLNGVMSGFYNDMQMSVNKIISEIENQVHDAIEETVQQKTKMLKQSLADLQNRQKMDVAELAERRQGLKGMMAKLTAIRRVIEEYIPSVKPQS